MKTKEWLKQQAEGIIKEWDIKGLEHADIQFLKQFITKKDLTILDLGCGNGELVNHFSQLGFVVIGVDLPEVIEKITEDEKMGVYHSLDLNKDEFVNGKYDIICAFSVIEHLYCDHYLLNNVREALKKDGLFLVSIPTKSNVSPNHCRFYPTEEWKRLIDLYGFEVVKQGYFDGPRLWALKKKGRKNEDG